MKYNLLTILGPTAVGKTRLATILAKEYMGEIISADSRQVYKGMDIGTGKDLADYEIDGVQIPYHLIDIADPKTDEFNLYEFGIHFKEAYKEIVERKRNPFLVGGTGLYIHSILKEYNLPDADLTGKRFDELNKHEHDELIQMLTSLNPDQHNTTDIEDKDRTIRAIIIEENKTKIPGWNKDSLNSFVIGVRGDRETIKKNITKRLKERLHNGMVEEVEKLMSSGVSKDKLEFFGLEYKYLSQYIAGEVNYNDMFQKLNSAIHKFAKRQMTWFRKMEREGIEIHWLEGPDVEEAKRIIDEQEIIING